MIPIPPHLAKYDWYAPHVAWLKARGYATTHEPGEAAECRANLRFADLCHANLRDANLRDADLRDAKNLPPAPVVPNIDQAILDALKTCGTLDMSTWHTCDTTHCRAGWAIVLAGEEGKKLESATSSYLAGRLIYEASRPGVPCPDFFASDNDALADIRACATVATDASGVMTRANEQLGRLDA